MPGWPKPFAALLGCALLAGCGTAGRNEQTPAFSGIAESERVRATGTEPFWNAEIIGGELTYTTPEDMDGTTIPVTRFAGNSGVGYSGTLRGEPLDLLVTEGVCSDGMSDRRYPFTTTLNIGDDRRSGCAWTDSRPFSGPAAP